MRKQLAAVAILGFFLGVNTLAAVQTGHWFNIVGALAMLFVIGRSLWCARDGWGDVI